MHVPGVIGVESLFGICLTLLMINSWWTSYQMAKGSAERGKLLKKVEDSSEEAAIPLLYSNY